jgi:hypothetical protein
MRSSFQDGRFHQGELSMVAQGLYPVRLVSAAGHSPKPSIQEEGLSRGLRRPAVATVQTEPPTTNMMTTFSDFTNNPQSTNTS